MNAKKKNARSNPKYPGGGYDEKEDQRIQRERERERTLTDPAGCVIVD